MPSVKEAARSIVDNLPGLATWDDLMKESYVKQQFEAGMEAADIRGRTPFPFKTTSRCRNRKFSKARSRRVLNSDVNEFRRSESHFVIR